MNFELPPIVETSNAWGPPMDLDAVDFGTLGIDFNLAFEHLDKYGSQQDRNFKIGKVCDFTLQGLKYAEQRMAKGKSKGRGKSALAPDKDEDGFALVDNKPPPGKSFGKGRGLFARGNKGRGRMSKDSNYQEGILGQKQKSQVSSMKGKGKGRNNFQQRRSAPSSREWSVQTQPEWEMKREITFAELGKIQIDARDVTTEDIVWCGDLQEYNKDFDRITARTEKTVKKYEELDFYNETTQADPKLQEVLENDESVTVIATTQVLACLVAAARSNYSWDLLVSTMTVGNRKVMSFDKRTDSPVDYLTTNETANNQSDDSDKKEMNSIRNLCLEATCINQNFSQFVLSGRRQEMDEPNPFAEEGTNPSSGALRYRKITIPGNQKESNETKREPIVVAVRTEVNCRMPGADNQFALVRALNEYDPKPNYSWRKLLQSQHGMVSATELKNNAFKFGRWTAEAILAGCDVMKVGYVTRMDPSQPWAHTNHSCLSVATYMTSTFAEQIGMHKNNMYGILRNLVDLLMEWEDGKYLILKDPMKPILRIYEVPAEFGEDCDDEDDDMEEDDGPDLDEEGNPTPMQAVGPNLG